MTNTHVADKNEVRIRFGATTRRPEYASRSGLNAAVEQHEDTWENVDFGLLSETPEAERGTVVEDRLLPSAIVAAQERVRKEIACHLHGHVQGKLLALRAHLHEIARSDGLSADTANNLNTIVADMGEVIQSEIALLSRRLYPSVLRLGIVAALHSLGDQYAGAMNIEIAIDEGFRNADKNKPGIVPEQARLMVYRIAEEALANIVKHARGSHVVVSLELSADDSLILTIRDSGPGFDQWHAGTGLGLSAMADYAAAAGGYCSITSEVGRGTSVEAKLPLIR